MSAKYLRVRSESGDTVALNARLKISFSYGLDDHIHIAPPKALIKDRLNTAEIDEVHMLSS